MLLEHALSLPLLINFLPSILRQSLSPEPNSLIWAVKLESLLGAPPVLLEHGITGGWPCSPDICVRAEDLNPSPHVYVTSALPTEPSPQSWVYPFEREVTKVLTFGGNFLNERHFENTYPPSGSRVVFPTLQQRVGMLRDRPGVRMGWLEMTSERL